MVSRIPHYCIVGGGISGLTTAYLISLLKPTGSYRLTLLEASSRYGGWIRSIRNPNTGAVYELGPHSARASGSSSTLLLRLALSLNLRESILWMCAGHKYIYYDNQLVTVSPLSPFASKPFTRSPLGLILKKAFSRPPPYKSDLSVDEFLRTRFDDEFADYLGSAMMRGIYAGDSRQLSARACLPYFVRCEEAGPNLILGYLKGVLLRQPSHPHHIPQLLESTLPTVTTFVPRKALAWSLSGGVQQFTDAISLALQEQGPHMTLLVNSPVHRIAYTSSSNQLEIRYKNVSGNSVCLNGVDSVFLCCPSFQSAEVLLDTLPKAALAPLQRDRIPWTNVAAAVLELEGDTAQPPNRGFGHLVPRSVDPHVLGVVYDSVAFPQLDGENKSVRYTVMMTPKPDWLTNTETVEREIVSESLKTLQVQLKISNPRLINSAAALLRDCIPQYPLHHIESVKAFRSELLAFTQRQNSPRPSRIHVVGSSYDGVGLGDVAFSALAAVSEELQLPM